MRIPVAEGTIEGYLAEPEGEGPFPGVVVIHDVLGHGEDARRITDRFAKDGYLALSPNMYSRGGALRCIRGVFRDQFRGSGQAFDDIEAARKALIDRPDCTGKVGIVGFCMGGGFALVAAAGEFDASAPYYGFLPKNLSVLDDACPIVASYGKKDLGLRGAAAKLENELSSRGIPHDVKEYPDCGHSFANRMKPGMMTTLAKITGMSYHEASAEDAWSRVLAFFSEHLSDRTPK
ncbi:dienelactone hydrolase family protein [Amycolatopsis sp. NPDC059657]|uniref:dienelactone hydrolase family protein n=1 Tax=Amycolatopsis sp. NPDC059657 TaxID=3346899 RepID=UPI00367188E1